MDLSAVGALSGLIPERTRMLLRQDLPTNILVLLLERVMGIEPTQSAWEADVLPLNYTRDLCSRLMD